MKPLKPLLLCLLLLSPLLFSPTQASAYACSDPYETLDCTDLDMSTANFNTIQPHKVTVGGGVFLYRYNRPQLTTLGYGDGVCILGGNIDLECLSVVVAQKAQDIDGRVVTLEASSPGARTFNATSRALNSCYQISATKDALFNYAVDVSTALSLTNGAEGTVTVTSYTNNSCTTGAVNIASGSPAQTGTLVVGLGVNQKVPVALGGMIPAGRWVKINTANTVGTPTFAIRATQQEVLF